MKEILLIAFCLLHIALYGQSIYQTIDTTNTSISKRINFIRNYYNSSTNEDGKKFWHPKLKDIINYNSATSIETFSRNNAPRRIKDGLRLEIIELEMLNDTLSYVKIEMRTPDDGIALATMKYYIIENNGVLYFDNAINYEKNLFSLYQTPNIDYYISPYKSFPKSELLKGSEVIDSLNNILLSKKDKRKIEVYLCSNIEEMNIVANMSKYYGRQGGFANSELGFTAFMYESPIHSHEFVHLLLCGTKKDNYILEEGIATLFGGLSPSQSYISGKNLIKECLISGTCSIEDIIQNRKNLTLQYTIWAVFCEYIINKLGKDKLFEFYYDKNVNDSNIINKVCDIINISEDQLFINLKNAILNNDK